MFQSFLMFELGFPFGVEPHHICQKSMITQNDGCHFFLIKHRLVPFPKRMTFLYRAMMNGIVFVKTAAR